MFGTNDLSSMEAAEYKNRMRAVVQRCLDNGSIVILSTIPPRSAFEAKSVAFAQAMRELARESKTPLLDYQTEIIQRRPTDWDGALEKFKAYEGYDVPTLISRDGVHPSLPAAYQGDYSPEALSHSGYALRSYLTLRHYAEILHRIPIPAALSESKKGGNSARKNDLDKWRQ